MELAIDTSSNTIGVALAQEGELMASLTWQTRRNHTMELLPNMVCLLQQFGIGLNSIQAIIVARGPGSFNGLRVGVSTAKSLAFSLNIPLVGINTFEAEAHSFAFIGLPVRPIHGAGRDEIATALYRQKDSELRCLERENITTTGVLCHRTKRRTLFCGEIPPDVVTKLEQGLNSRAVISRSCTMSRASSLAILGWRKLSRGERDDHIALQPLYLRPPHITTSKKRVPFMQRQTYERT